MLAAVVAAAVAAILGVTVALTRSSGPSTVVLALQPPVEASTGSGRVTMTTSGADRTMTVDTRLAVPLPGSFYEVWLLNQATGQMLSVGVLPDDGKARFSVPASIFSPRTTPSMSPSSPTTAWPPIRPTAC